MAKSEDVRRNRARAIRANMPQEWTRFLQLWIAFNAIYGGEADARERARIKAAIRKNISEAAARRILGRTDVAIDRILATPPGDTRLGPFDAEFRRASREQARLYKTSKRALDKLVATGGILYQVRCNLVHGGKHPVDVRDQMLVRESARVLEVLVPELESD